MVALQGWKLMKPLFNPISTEGNLVNPKLRPNEKRKTRSKFCQAYLKENRLGRLLRSSLRTVISEAKITVISKILSDPPMLITLTKPNTVCAIIAVVEEVL